MRNLEVSPLTPGIGQECLSPSTPFYHWTRSPKLSKKTRKGNKGILLGREKINLSSQMTQLSLKHLKDSIKNYPELTSHYSKVAGFRLNTQKVNHYPNYQQ